MSLSFSFQEVLRAEFNSTYRYHPEACSIDIVAPEVPRVLVGPRRRRTPRSDTTLRRRHGISTRNCSSLTTPPILISRRAEHPQHHLALTDVSTVEDRFRHDRSRRSSKSQKSKQKRAKTQILKECIRVSLLVSNHPASNHPASQVATRRYTQVNFDQTANAKESKRVRESITLEY